MSTAVAHPQRAAWLVILAGVSAALHVGKLPPALPMLQDQLGVSLLQSGFLLSMVQMAGMSLGLATGLMADGVGLRRSMLIGLALLGAASALGGWATQPEWLLLLRAFEGLGFLLVTMPAPSLLRVLVRDQRISATLGLWGAYMPLGTSLALLLGPWVLAAAGWQPWWWLLAGISLLLGLALLRWVPADRRAQSAQATGTAGPDGWQQRLRQTLGAGAPWLMGASFACYSSQWLAVVGFLPSIYAQAGLAPGWVGLLSAGVAGGNIVGNVLAGRLLQRGWHPPVLMAIGYTTMGTCAVLAFVLPLPAVPRYLAVLLFSMVGGMTPTTLFNLAVRLAPGPNTISSTVGLVHQCSSLGQFMGPPLVAWAASRSGGWGSTGWICATASSLGLLLAFSLHRRLRA